MVATWVGIGVLVVFNLCGWLWSLHRQSKNEARHMGALEQKVEDLGKTVGSLVETVDGLGERLDGIGERVSAVESILSTHFGKSG
jgi:hypothetical protein